jgi:hypothetical protein
MSTATLYSLTAEWAAIEQALIDSEGELTPELEARLDSLPGELALKVDGYCALIESFEAAAQNARRVVERAKALSSVRQNAANRMRERLKEAMQIFRQDKISTPNFVARIQRNSRPSIRWTKDLESIPPEFVKVTRALDGNAAYDTWRILSALPVGFEIEHGTHLRIQ